MDNRFTTIGIFVLCVAILVGFKLDQPLITVLEEQKVNFHTPAFPSGYVLPERITGNLQLSPKQGVIIVTGTSIVETNAQLIIEPGTTFAMNEYSAVIVYGHLKVAGTTKQPISFITNELHELNRTWSGILFMDGSSGSIDYATFHHASPSVSCMEETKVLITHTLFAFGNLAVFGPCSYTP